jgi:tRNA(fMet)-specific endonuclease VapC
VYLLDTTVWIDLIRTNSSRIRRRLSAAKASEVGISIITICELRYGLERQAVRRPESLAENERFLLTLLSPFQIFLLDHGVVLAYGKVRVALERSGRGIGALDTFIAAQALSLDATLVTSNLREFSRVPGLQVEDWR